jgi:hypothetical protein
VGLLGYDNVIGYRAIHSNRHHSLIFHQQIPTYPQLANWRGIYCLAFYDPYPVRQARKSLWKLLFGAVGDANHGHSHGSAAWLRFCDDLDYMLHDAVLDAA